jgi:hypothetical protein
LSNADSSPIVETIYKECSDEELSNGCIPNEKILGISFDYESDNPCSLADIENYSFQVNVFCDEEITEEGAGVIRSAEIEKCQVIVDMAHAAGCPVFSF